MKNFDILKLVDKAITRFGSLTQIVDTLADFIAPKKTVYANHCPSCGTIACSSAKCVWNGSQCKWRTEYPAFMGSVNGGCTYLCNSPTNCVTWGSSCGSQCVTP